MVEGFCFFLSDYPMPVILGALGQYVRAHSDIPTPSDLVKIIDPPPPVLSAAAFTALRKRIEEGYYPDSEDRAFLRAFEAQEYAKVRS